MGLESWFPTNESGVYQLLREISEGFLYMERVEPSNESGFPDIYFVIRPGFRRGEGAMHEGTIELKHFRPNEKVDLTKSKVRGNQKAALLEYSQAGGNRRFVIAHQSGVLQVYATQSAAAAILRRPQGFASYDLNSMVSFGEWDPSGESLIDWRNWFTGILS